MCSSNSTLNISAVKNKDKPGKSLDEAENTPLVQSMSESVQNALRTMWGRADRYHYRCILQLQNLRQQIVAGAVSGDINSKETRVMHGVSENLMLNALRMRQNLASAVESLEDMSHYIISA